MEVILSPNPVLLQVAEECTQDESFGTIAKEMQDLMYKYNGIGLAGPQVGLSKRIIVVDAKYDPEDTDNTKAPITLINPQIIKTEGELEESSEGCLSCPGISVPVMRYPKVTVKYFDTDWNEQTIEAEDLFAHCLQHEIDHLDGKTLFQTCLPEYRIQALSEYQEALNQGAIPGDC
ncbi:MAG: peptide deformylase [Coriobacteriia bacterium]|nr:peptide deformylase [Coriobacteriia bacterium]